MNVVSPFDVNAVIIGKFQAQPNDPAVAVAHIIAHHGSGNQWPNQFHPLWNTQLSNFVTTGFRHSIFVRHSIESGHLIEERRVMFPANFPVGWNSHGLTNTLTIIYNRAADTIVTAYPGQYLGYPGI